MSLALLQIIFRTADRLGQTLPPEIMLPASGPTAAKPPGQLDLTVGELHQRICRTLHVRRELSGNAVVQDDQYCIRCQYNLRTLSVNNVCPECGVPVGRSLGGTDTQVWHVLLDAICDQTGVERRYIRENTWLFFDLHLPRT